MVTNTRFTTDAEEYGLCSGMKMVSWDFPAQDSLRNQIDNSGLHPITSLKSLTAKEKQKILEAGFVLCKEITENILLKNMVAQNKIKRVLLEAQSLSDY